VTELASDADSPTAPPNQYTLSGFLGDTLELHQWKDSLEVLSLAKTLQKQKDQKGSLH